MAESAASSKLCAPNQERYFSVQVDPSRQTLPWRNKKWPSRFFARVTSSTASPRARHRSRTASSRTDGTRIATSSPARNWRTIRLASRLSVLTRSPGAVGIKDGAITSHDTFNDANSRYNS